MNPERPQTDGTGALRVILVGRSSIDRPLRRDARIELVRARTALEAVGELADPIDADSPADAVVLVGAGGEPAPGPGVSAGDEVKRFVAALRMIDENVRVLRLGARAEEGYDGALSEDATADELFACVRGETVQEPKAVAPHVPEPMAPAPVADTGGDAELAAALVRGRELAPLALERLRVRTGIDDLRLVEGEEGAIVEWNGRVYGRLRTDSDVGEGALAHAAAWLAAWLRLGEQHAELSEAAFTDPLTGAWNRRYFDRFLASALETTRKRRGSLTLMLFDLDDFKSFNDAAGHVAGDEILRETVRLMRSVVRPTDRVCRIGGDEFAVVFYEPEGPREAASQHPQDTSVVLARFQSAIRAKRFPRLGEQAPAPLTISGGLATYPWDAHDAEGLVARADELAMESKRTGKNRITFGRAEAGPDPEA